MKRGLLLRRVFFTRTHPAYSQVRDRHSLENALKSGLAEPPGEPVGGGAVDLAADIHFCRGDTLSSQHEKETDPIGEPKMRIGHGTKLVPVMLEGKVIGALPGFDRQQVLWNGPAMDHDIGIYRFADI